jgi:hypothetical protein
MPETRLHRIDRLTVTVQQRREVVPQRMRSDPSRETRRLDRRPPQMAERLRVVGCPNTVNTYTSADAG